MGKLHKIGKFYTRIMMKQIGIFIFTGILLVAFHDHGWFPNEDIYAISQLIYTYAIPLLIAYEGGKQLGEHEGGILAVMAECGFLAAGSAGGILGAMILGPLSGAFILEKEKWIHRVERSQKKILCSSFGMLGRNLTVALMGVALAVFGRYVLAPVFVVVTEVLSGGVHFLAEHHLIGALSIIIEPAKVFFLNNLVHHAILAPLGLEQVQETGGSILFLLETNPGPGFGVLAALCWRWRERKNEYASAMVAEFLGGIHEVYFPFVLENLWLLIPLVLGGFAGNFCFSLMGAEVGSVISPGSVIILLLLAGKEMFLPVLLGIIVSAIVSFWGSVWVLKRYDSGKKRHDTASNIMENQKEIAGTDSNKLKMENEEEKMIEKSAVKKIAFVCDGGMGSSAMGAAIFRRMLAGQGMEDIFVKQYAVDLVPPEITFIVCQKDYTEMVKDQLGDREIFAIESLVQAEAYQPLLEEIKRRNQCKG